MAGRPYSSTRDLLARLGITRSPAETRAMRRSADQKPSVRLLEGVEGDTHSDGTHETGGSVNGLGAAEAEAA